MRPAATPKLRALVMGAGFILLVGLTTGQVEVLALAVPLLMIVARGIGRAAAPTVSLRFEVDADRITEGEAVGFAIEVTSDRDLADVEIALLVPPSFTVTEGSALTNAALLSSQAHPIGMTATATRWGAHLVGIVAVRVFGPGRVLVYEHLHDLRRVVKVFPRTERLHRYVVPHRPQRSTGEYVSRLAGDGIEFANVRRLQAGDSPRRVNWRVSSRSDQLYVNTFHVERNSDVVFFIDAFGDVGEEGSTALDVTVRGVASLAQHYLAKRDRVALISFGGALRWLQHATGRAQIYRIVDFLLDVSVTTSLAWKEIDLVPPRILLPGSLVVAFSPLIDQRSIGALGAIQERGASLVVLDTLDEAAVPSPPGPEGELAHRVWKLRREMFRRELATSGIPIATLATTPPLEEVLASIPRRRTAAMGA